MDNIILIIVLITISLVWNWYLLFDKYNTKKEISQENKGEKNDEKDALKYIVKIDDKDRETRAIFLWNESKFPLEIVLEETQEKASWKIWESLYIDFEYKKWIISSINEYLKTNDLEEKYLLTLKRIIEKQYEWQKDTTEENSWKRDKDFWYKTSLEHLLETINQKLAKIKK